MKHSPGSQKRYYRQNKEILLEKAVLYRQSHREELRLKAAEIRKTYSHPCPDCGKLVKSNAARCHSCAAKILNAPRKVIYSPCIDCGGVVSRGRGLRCRKCCAKARRKIQRLDGKHQTIQGYIKIGGVEEHRMVWEQANGLLPKGFVIHHINGRRDDNRLKNLIALPKDKHHYALLMQSKDKRIQELEGLLMQQRQLI